jgi:peptidoglycan/xylan/chitin deacetylase (PgdA/CDA1 family)
MDHPPLSPSPSATDISQISETPAATALSRISRRGFILATAAMASCRAADPLPLPGRSVPKPPSVARPSAGPSGPVPRNPDMAHPSNFSRNSGVTFTRVPMTGKFVAITFDDGPHPQNTPRLLNMLRERNIPATFYVIGRSVDLYPQIVRRCVQEGHEIGNHSHTHRLLSKLSDSEVRSDLARCRDSIQRAAGVRPRTMRPPYGGLTLRQRDWVHAEFGYPTILWSVDPLDWKRPGASVVASRIVSGASAGGIILAHDLHSQTVDAMPAALDGLLRRGYQFVTVSQLLAMKSEPAAATQAAVTANTY